MCLLMKTEDMLYSHEQGSFANYHSLKFYPRCFRFCRSYRSCMYLNMSVPVAARSKAWVCGRSPAETVGSNPIGGHGCLSVVSVVCCQVEVCATG